jgi:predicted 3-demethylubiquinone-9 3-methyltransferase (glyoxalase superfamily)
MGQKITPFLWFNNQAEDAANFYISVFKNSEILTVQRIGEGGPGEIGSAWVVDFTLEGQLVRALNGGPHYTLNEAFSFQIDCGDQEEVDYYWDKLTEGGEPIACGWLKDKFGLTWQVVPRRLVDLLGDPDPGRAGRVMQAMMEMSKIEIAKLEEAADAV